MKLTLEETYEYEKVCSDPTILCGDCLQRGFPCARLYDVEHILDILDDRNKCLDLIRLSPYLLLTQYRRDR